MTGLEADARPSVVAADQYERCRQRSRHVPRLAGGSGSGNCSRRRMRREQCQDNFSDILGHILHERIVRLTVMQPTLQHTKCRPICSTRGGCHATSEESVHIGTASPCTLSDLHCPSLRSRCGDMPTYIDLTGSHDETVAASGQESFRPHPTANLTAHPTLYCAATCRPPCDAGRRLPVSGQPLPVKHMDPRRQPDAAVVP